MQRHLSWALRWFADTGADITLVTTAGGALPPDSGARSIEIPDTRPGRYSGAWWRGTRRFIRERPLSEWDAIVSENGGAWAVVEAVRRDRARPPIAMFRHGTTLATIRSSIPPRHPRGVGIALLSLRDYLRHPRRLARSVDLMIALSDTIAQSARTEGAGTETEVRVVRLGVDLQRFFPSSDVAADRRALGLDPSVPTLTWVGRDTTSKRATLALSVMDRLSARGLSCQMALAVVEPSWTSFHVAYRTGARHPVGRGAAGRAIVAGRLGEPTWQSSTGELESGAHGVAAPVLGVDGLEASVGVIALAPLDPEVIGPEVLAAAAALAAVLTQ